MRFFIAMALLGVILITSNFAFAAISISCPSYANCAGQECGWIWKGRCTGHVDPWTGAQECYCSRAIRVDEPGGPE